MIDFEIAVENEPRAASLPSKQGSTPEQTSLLEEGVMKISGLLSSVSRQQKYFRTRENRNFSTVRSTESRIWNFSLIESLMMVGMAGIQVFVVRMFFTGGRKGEFVIFGLDSFKSCALWLTVIRLRVKRFYRSRCTGGFGTIHTYLTYYDSTLFNLFSYLHAWVWKYLKAVLISYYSG